MVNKRKRGKSRDELFKSCNGKHPALARRQAKQIRTTSGILNNKIITATMFARANVRIYVRVCSHRDNKTQGCVRGPGCERSLASFISRVFTFLRVRNCVPDDDCVKIDGTFIAGFSFVHEGISFVTQRPLYNVFQICFAHYRITIIIKILR